MTSSVDTGSWLGEHTELRLNPRLDRASRVEAEAWVESSVAPVGLLWIRTSGSEGEPRLVGLSREALRCSAEAVNDHLEVTTADRWLLALPTFHVGGLGVLVRAHLAGIEVSTPFADAPWDATLFHDEARRTHATLSALVPAQVFDLVRLGRSCPPSLRSVVIGGDALDDALRMSARGLGYPLLASYGLTECSSQVATAPLASLSSSARPPLKVLRHVQARTNEEGRLELRSAALCDGYLTSSGDDVTFVDPKQGGWLTTGDAGRVEGGELFVQGRGSGAVKIGGELVSLGPLAARLEHLRRDRGERGDAAIVARADDRLGHRLWLVVDADVQAPKALRADFDARVLPFERCAGVLRVETIPRTELGKLRRASLEEHLPPTNQSTR